VKRQKQDFTELEERVKKKEVELEEELHNRQRASNIDERLQQQEERHSSNQIGQSFMNLGDILSNIMPDFNTFINNRRGQNQEQNSNGNSNQTGPRRNMFGPPRPPPPSGLT